MTKYKSLKVDNCSEKTIKGLKGSPSAEVTYTFTYTLGLTLRIAPSGSKTFYARIWNPVTRKVLRRKLGRWPEMNAATAQKALREFKREMVERRWSQPVFRPSLSKAYSSFVERKKLEQKSVSYLQQLDQAWNCIPDEIRSLRLDDIPMCELSNLVLNISSERKGTAFHLRRLLKAIYKYALANEWCVKDRTLTITPIHLQPRRLLVDNSQIAKVLEVARMHQDKHKVSALLICAGTGQRGAEIMRLRWENVGTERIVFPADIRKQRTEHVVWINQLAREGLSLLPVGKGPLFPMAHRNWLSDFGKVIGRKAGVKQFGVHQLRKAVVSNLLSQGVPVHIVQQVTGHKDASILMKHYAISTTRQTKAAVMEIEY